MYLLTTKYKYARSWYSIWSCKKLPRQHHNYSTCSVVT